MTNSDLAAAALRMGVTETQTHNNNNRARSWPVDGLIRNERVSCGCGWRISGFYWDLNGFRLRQLPAVSRHAHLSVLIVRVHIIKVGSPYFSATSGVSRCTLEVRSHWE